LSGILGLQEGLLKMYQVHHKYRLGYHPQNKLPSGDFQLGNEGYFGENGCKIKKRLDGQA